MHECFDGDFSKSELDFEISNVHVFDRENSNPVSKTIEYFINNHKGQPKSITNKHGKRLLSSYKYQMVGHIGGGFDNYIVLNPLPSAYKCSNLYETPGGLIKGKL